MTNFKATTETVSVGMMDGVKSRLQTIATEVDVEAHLEALDTLAGWIDRPLSQIPASAEALRGTFETMRQSARSLGFRHFAATRRLCIASLGLAEVKGHEALQKREPVLGVEWQSLLLPLTSDEQRRFILQFAKWCSGRGIPPAKVEQSTFGTFHDHLSKYSTRADIHKISRQVAIRWNLIARAQSDRCLAEVAVPPTRLRRTITPITAFPEPLRRQLDDYATYLRCDDPFAPNARPVPLTAATVDTKMRHIYRALHVMVRTGVPVGEVISLDQLVEIEMFRTLCRRLDATAKGRASLTNFFIASDLIQLARWLALSAAHIARLEGISRKMPRPTFRMTLKNKNLVRRLLDKNVMANLYATPRKSMDAALAKTPWSSITLGKCMASVGIGILLNAPLRIANLASLRLGHSLLRQKDGTYVISLPAYETKDRKHLFYPLPADISEIIDKYIFNVVPMITGKECSYLFCNIDGTCRGASNTSAWITQEVKIATGINVHIHIFRHLSAELILRRHPGNYMLVMQFLGHTSLDATRRYYRDTDPEHAARLHAGLVHEEL